MSATVRDESYVGWVLRGLNDQSRDGGRAFMAALHAEDEGEAWVSGRRYSLTFTHEGVRYGYRIVEHHWAEI